jgi:hypothetical protein
VPLTRITRARDVLISCSIAELIWGEHSANRLRRA